MAFSLEQQTMLEAMGLRLYVPVPRLDTETFEQRESSAAFWQSRLGQNIQRFAQGHELTALPVASAHQGKLAKRMLWQQVRALLKPR